MISIKFLNRSTALGLFAVLALSMADHAAYPLTLTPRAVLQNAQTIYTIGTTMTASQVQIQSTHVYLGSKYYDLTSASGKVYANITGFNESVDITVKILNTTLTDVKFTILGQAQRVQIDGIFYDLGTRWSYITDSSGNPATQVNVTNGKNVFVSFVQAFNVKKGSFAKTTAPAPATQNITGVGFKPKALILYTTAQSAEGFADTYYFAIGVSDGATSRTVAVGSANAVSPSTALAAGLPNVMVTINSTMATIAIADLVSFNTDGFTLNWTTNDATPSIIHYLALGGGDLTNTKVGEFTENTVTGNQAVTGVGFLPDFVMFMHFGTNGTVITDGYTSLGFAKSPTKEGALAVTSVGGVKTTSTFRDERTDRCIVELKPHTGALNAEASFVSMDTNGFTINWLSAPASADKVFYLALKGGQYDVGSFTEKSGTGPQAVTGVGFTPKGLMLASVNNVASMAVASNNRLSFGAAHAAGAGNEGTVWSGDKDKVKPSITARSTLTTKIIRLATEAAPSSSSTPNGEADLSSFDSNGGFTLNWTTSDTVARQILYVAFGDVPWESNTGYLVSNPITLEDSSTVYPLNQQTLIDGLFSRSDAKCHIYTSTDGGITWSLRYNVTLTPLSTQGSDPVVTASKNGTLYSACLSFNLLSPPFSVSDIVVSKSNNGGANWTDLTPTVVHTTNGFGQDKEWIAADQSSNTVTQNNVYLTWVNDTNTSVNISEIKFKRLQPPDSGPPQTLTRGPPLNNVTGPSIAIGPQGQVYIAYENDTSPTGGEIDIVRSYTAGTAGSWTHKTVGTFIRYPICNLPIQHETTDCIRGFENTPFRAAHLPSIGVDPTGTVHITYENYSGPITRGDILYTQSSNCKTSGDPCTFSKLIKINLDNTNTDKFQPQLVVSTRSLNATIHVVVYDRRDDPTNVFWIPYDYHCNVATDCTKSGNWVNTKITGVTGLQSTNYDHFDVVGDYHGLASSALREAYPTWTRNIGPSGSSNYDIFANRSRT